MKSRLPLALILILAATPAFAAKVFIDHDTNYDFSSIKTFAWAPTPDTSVEGSDPLMHSRIVNAIEHYISQGGVREVKENPDVYVTYHTNSKEEMQLNTSSFGYGYPGGWGWGGYGYGMGWGGGMASSTTSVSTYEVGTLVVDVWDADAKELVWRGTATNIYLSANPDKMMKKIDKALAKIVKKSQQLELRSQTGN
jgi:hypothetical protein